jgi:hypothetical protein
LKEKQRKAELRSKNYQNTLQPKFAEQQRRDEENEQRAMRERERLEAEREAQSKNAKVQVSFL